MDLSNLGIAIITFILAITSHQTSTLIQDHRRNQFSNSVSFSQHSLNTRQYSAGYAFNSENGLNTSSHSGNYPCSPY